MDLNYLLFRQQVERSMAASADCDAAREAHEALANEYESRIGMTANARGPRVAARDAAMNAPLAVAVTAREVENG